MARYRAVCSGADWLHVSTFAVAAPARGHGFGKQLMKRAGLYAVKRACIDAFLDIFGFQASRRVSRSRLVLRKSGGVNNRGLF